MRQTRRFLSAAAIMFCVGFIPVAAVMIAAGAALIVWSVGELTRSAPRATVIGDVSEVRTGEMIAWGVFVGLATMLLVGQLVVHGVHSNGG